MLTALLLIAATPYWWTTADPDLLRLWEEDKVLVGEYRLSTDTWRPWSGTAGRCVLLPNARPPVPPPDRNFGVSDDADLKAARCTLGGNKATMQEVIDSIPGPLPDRSNMPWIVAVGGTAQQRKDLLAKLPADVLAKYRTSSKDAGHWHMRPGYRPGDPVALCALHADGTEFHRQTDGEVTPALIAALREPDKNYDPAKSPDLRKMMGGLRIPPSLLVVGAMLAGTVALVRRPKPPAVNGAQP